MCRLLGLISPRPLRSRYLEAFRGLASAGCVAPGSPAGHHDGWGIVLYHEGYPAYLGREPSDAARDPMYGEVVEKFADLRPRGIVLAHLRKASVGDVSRENTQPYIHGPWAFAHNGTIRDFHMPVTLKLQGTTDSERFFKAIAERMERGVPPREAIEEVVTWIRGHNDFTSLTFLLADGRNVYGYREWKREEGCGYYTLSYLRDRDTVVLSQEPVLEGIWRPIENRQLITIGPDLSLSLRQL